MTLQLECGGFCKETSVHSFSFLVMTLHKSCARQGSDKPQTCLTLEYDIATVHLSQKRLDRVPRGVYWCDETQSAVNIGETPMAPRNRHVPSTRLQDGSRSSSVPFCSPCIVEHSGSPANLDFSSSSIKSFFLKKKGPLANTGRAHAPTGTLSGLLVTLCEGNIAAWQRRASCLSWTAEWFF